MSASDAQIAMHDLYEHTYGIHNHSNGKNKHPFASVLFHESEDFITGSLLEKDIEAYRINRVWDIFHISLTEFLDLPPYIGEMLINSAMKEIQKKGKDLDDVKNELDKM